MVCVDVDVYCVIVLACCDKCNVLSIHQRGRKESSVKRESDETRRDETGQDRKAAIKS